MDLSDPVINKNIHTAMDLSDPVINKNIHTDCHGFK